MTQRNTILAALTILFAPPVWAVRPFITDDAAIIGFKRIELANWLLIDKYAGQFWHSANIGLHDRVEMTLAMFWGYDKPGGDNHAKMSFTAPLLQTKFLLRDYEPDGLPGMTVAVGSDLPYGTGAFVPRGYGAFAFASVTQCIGKEENVLIHTNLGITYLREGGENHTGITWGTGTQVKIHKGFHCVGELVSGDPYVHGAGIAYQLGIRQFVSDKLQVDCALGNGIGGGVNKTPLWVSCGIRYVVSLNKSGNYARNGRKICQ
jgi:hypothetical protein